MLAHWLATGAPPRTRGWTLGRELPGSLVDGSPAHAGMDPRLARGWYEPARLPRARGDGPAWACSRHGSRRAPPRTRGWTRRDEAAQHHGQGSPAHAGMDPADAWRATDAD